MLKKMVTNNKMQKMIKTGQSAKSLKIDLKTSVEHYLSVYSTYNLVDKNSINVLIQGGILFF